MQSCTLEQFSQSETLQLAEQHPFSREQMRSCWNCPMPQFASLKCNQESGQLPQLSYMVALFLLWNLKLHEVRSDFFQHFVQWVAHSRYVSVLSLLQQRVTKCLVSTTKIYWSNKFQARSQKSRCWSGCFLENYEGESLWCLSCSFRGYRHGSACINITPTSAFIFTHLFP